MRQSAQRRRLQWRCINMQLLMETRNGPMRMPGAKPGAPHPDTFFAGRRATQTIIGAQIARRSRQKRAIQPATPFLLYIDALYMLKTSS